jgi:hypothetical protein
LLFFFLRVEVFFVLRLDVLDLEVDFFVVDFFVLLDLLVDFFVLPDFDVDFFLVPDFEVDFLFADFEVDFLPVDFVFELLLVLFEEEPEEREELRPELEAAELLSLPEVLRLYLSSSSSSSGPVM